MCNGEDCSIKESWYVLYLTQQIVALTAENKRLREGLERISQFDSCHQEWPNDIFINAPPEDLASFILRGVDYPPETFKEAPGARRKLVEMDEITKEKVEQYIKIGGNYCPYCHSSEVEQEDMLILDEEDTKIYRHMTCLTCFKDWTDVYSLADVKAMTEI